MGRWVIGEGCRRVRGGPSATTCPTRVREPLGPPVPRSGPGADHPAAIAETGSIRQTSPWRSPRAPCSPRASRPWSESASYAPSGCASRSTTWDRLLVPRLPPWLRDRRAQDRARLPGAAGSATPTCSARRSSSSAAPRPGHDRRGHRDAGSAELVAAPSGCRLGQGYRYARPMAAADLDRCLRRQLGVAPHAGRHRTRTLRAASPGFPGSMANRYSGRKSWLLKATRAS